MHRQRAAVVACALLVAAAPEAMACELVLTEHRSERPLAHLALDPVRPAARIAFTHSVLGTPVIDHYEWRRHSGQWRAHLVQEHYQGDGYGLPNAAGPGGRSCATGTDGACTLTVSCIPWSCCHCRRNRCVYRSANNRCCCWVR